MHSALQATPGQLLPQSPGATSAPSAREPRELGGVVRELVTRLLPDGSPAVQSVAEMLGVSARTLQRRLSEEGLTFLGIVARARCDVARRMLDDPARKVIDVALDLGYSDQAHFTRAFVRWTGRAPREFQRLRATGSSGGPAPGPRNPPASWVPQGNAGERPGHRGSKAEKRQELTTWTPYGLRIVALGGPRP